MPRACNYVLTIIHSVSTKRKLRRFAFAFSLALFLAACSSQRDIASPTSPAAPEKPFIRGFYSIPENIQAGQPAVLSWDVTGEYTSATLTASVGASPGSVSGTQVTVYPSDDTKYTLTVTGPGGTDSFYTYTWVDSVTPTPPPPTPVPDPDPPTNPDPPEEPAPPEEPSNPDDYGLEYWVRSDCGEVFVTYATVDGGTEQGYYGNGWVYRAWGNLDGEFVYVSAQNQCDYGSVTVRIKKFGKTFKESTSRGAYVIATASGTY